MEDAETGSLNVIVETPKGSRSKFKYTPDYGLFTISAEMPLGSVFPFDFGFIPSTQGEDGDPLDVLLLMEDAAFHGCWIRSRVIGVIEAEQTERDGKTERNDRLIAVAAHSHAHQTVEDLSQVNANTLEEIEHFFASYNAIRGKEFRVLARRGREDARALVEQGAERKKGGEA